MVKRTKRNSRGNRRRKNLKRRPGPGHDPGHLDGRFRRGHIVIVLTMHRTTGDRITGDRIKGRAYELSSTAIDLNRIKN